MVNIVNIVTDNPDSRNISQILPYRGRAYFAFFLLQFFDNAFWGLQSIFHVMNGIMIKFDLEFFVKYFKLCLYFFNSLVVQLLNRKKLPDIYKFFRILKTIFFSICCIGSPDSIKVHLYSPSRFLQLYNSAIK